MNSGSFILGGWQMWVRKKDKFERKQRSTKRLGHVGWGLSPEGTDAGVSQHPTRLVHC